MEVTVTSHRESSEVTLRVVVNAVELEPFMRSAARHLSRAHPVAGWRPGRAPLAVVERVAGAERLMNETIQRALPRLLARALHERRIEAIGRPAVTMEAATRQRGIAFRARTAVLPAVTLGKLTALRYERRPVSVSDDDVERELKRLARMRCQYLDIARPAQNGDTVITDFRIVRDGKVLEGGEGKRQAVHLGESHFLPDFEKGLLGIRAGEKREFTMVFPLTYGRMTLRGASATVSVTALAVQKRVLPEIDDAFARALGDFKDLASLRYTLKSSLIQEREVREAERHRAVLAERLAASAQFSPLPAVLVDAEVEQRMAEVIHILERQQTTLDAYVSQRGTTVEALRAELRAAAVQAVKVGLALRQFAAEQQICISDEELDQAAQAYLSRVSHPSQTRGAPDRDMVKEHLADLLRQQKTLERLEEVALENAG